MVMKWRNSVILGMKILETGTEKTFLIWRNIVLKVIISLNRGHTCMMSQILCSNSPSPSSALCQYKKSSKKAQQSSRNLKENSNKLLVQNLSLTPPLLWFYISMAIYYAQKIEKLLSFQSQKSSFKRMLLPKVSFPWINIKLNQSQKSQKKIE